ncbi:MAG TPA: hypothetical protein VEB59_08295 [Gemmatimonadales bacterium]|nr:hypothetical protein [Gemmatimonadales bacterium]
MTNTTMVLALLATVLAIAVGGILYTPLAAARARRRTVWELDRAEWRRWITRP